MVDEQNPKNEARILTPIEGGGEYWWRKHVESDGKEIDRRFRAAGTVFWNAGNLVTADVFSYISEASICFSVSMYIGTILLSSALPELILNRDSRTAQLSSLSRFDGWATLNNGNLFLAGEAGLPVAELLSPGEDLSSRDPVQFVRRRNKFAHGEIINIIRGISRYDPGTETGALDQLKKAQTFYVEWFNSTPDIAR